MPEFAVVTEDGVKVADLAWMSHEVWTRIKTETAASRAPEICVEILSDRNALPEIERKAAPYFAKSVPRLGMSSTKLGRAISISEACDIPAQQHFGSAPPPKKTPP